MRACVRVRVRVHACVRACVRACVCVCVRVREGELVENTSVVDSKIAECSSLRFVISKRFSGA